MYHSNSIYNILYEKIKESPASLIEIIETIESFINKLNNDKIVREVFKTNEINEMGEKLGLWIINDEYFFGSKNQIEEETKPIEELIGLLKLVVKTSLLNEKEKENFIISFAKHFAECSEDEDYCEGKIFVVIQNLTPNSGINILKEYNSWEDAHTDIEDIYIGCCDDVYIAEEMWFPILSYLTERECDKCKNFSSIIEFDATNIEDTRELWEKNNCNENADD